MWWVAHVVPAVNPALRSANLGLCARLRARIARPKVLNAFSGTRSQSGVTILKSVGAFDVQLNVRKDSFDVQLKVGSRLGVLASGTVCGHGWPQPSPQGWVHGVFRKPIPQGGLRRCRRVSEGKKKPA